MTSVIVLASLNVAINLAIIVLPWVLASAAFMSWVSYRRTKWQYERVNGKLFQILLPPEVTKSPVAIELILNALYDKSYGSRLQAFKDGRVPMHYSLEIASFAGEVKFFLWLPSKIEKIGLGAFYAQYPNVEFMEASDYVQNVIAKRDKYEMWGGSFATTKPNEESSLPTYREYELEKNPDVENVIDPLLSLMEYLGSLGYGEECWVQILLKGNYTKTWRKIDAPPFKPKPSLNDKIEAYIQKLKDGARVKRPTTEDDNQEGLFNFEPGTSDDIKDARKRQGKFHFDVLIRGIYLAQKEQFNGLNVPNLIKALQQFGDSNNNGIGPRFETDFDDPAKDYSRVSKTARKYFNYKKRIDEVEYLKAFSRRSGFDQPHKNIHHASFALSTDEIATLFHLPSTAATTPTIQRIDARKSDPPSNIPV